MKNKTTRTITPAVYINIARSEHEELLVSPPRAAETVSRTSTSDYGTGTRLVAQSDDQDVVIHLKNPSVPSPKYDDVPFMKKIFGIIMVGSGSSSVLADTLDTKRAIIGGREPSLGDTTAAELFDGIVAFPIIHTVISIVLYLTGITPVVMPGFMILLAITVIITTIRDHAGGWPLWKALWRETSIQIMYCVVLIGWNMVGIAFNNTIITANGALTLSISTMLLAGYVMSANLLELVNTANYWKGDDTTITIKDTTFYKLNIADFKRKKRLR
ncbi:hypothetical protein BMS3Bbin04_01861 [bacterium BMS3Bbin04]|nr:hypothetical protein BMS3Bbin04_01861 [bacterium BMS3Bbin04]